MVKIIVHRINKLKNYIKLKNFYGIETDVRDFGSKIVLSHNPHTNGEDFFKFVKKIDKTIFLNIKSSGILKKIIHFVKNKDIYFLDISFSEFDLLFKKNLSHRFILRFSSYENFNLNSKYFKKIKWIWFDYFNNSKLTLKNFKYLKKNKKKICIVSPDLLGKKKDILKYIKYLNKNKIAVDAVCTKKQNIKLWKNNYIY